MLTATSIRHAITMLFDNRVTITERTPVYGGDINRSYRLDLSNGARLFLKSNTTKCAPIFPAEAAGLEALRESGAIGVPQPLVVGTDRGRDISFILMEYLESARQVRDYWEIFGHELAALHRMAGPPLTDGPFGFAADNFIGTTQQKNTPDTSWVAFFRDCRLMPQMELAGDRLDPGTRRILTRLLEHLEDYLPEPAFPSLLHGDLWCGNTLCGPDGKAWIIDPAAYVGHFEADLAMTELFGGYPERFYGAYHEVNPIDCEYPARRSLYNLYHLLNHLNLFGGTYLDAVREAAFAYA